MLNFFFHRQGFSSVEFLLTAIPVLLLGMGTYEVTRWYNTRHLINLALVEAARAGSVHHAMPTEIERSFEQALTPLFATASNPVQQRQSYLHKVTNAAQVPAWRIIIKSPTQEHFNDFHRDDLDIAQQTGHYAIDNNYQKEQHEQKGIGLNSRQSIYEANTLSLSLSYAYEPIVPGMKFLFKQLRHAYTDQHAYQLLSHGYLPIQHELSISMQSHPVQWPSLSNGKVITTSHVRSTVRSLPLPPEACRGIWCQTPSKALNPSSNNPPLLENSKSPLSSHQSSLPSSHSETPPAETSSNLDHQAHYMNDDNNHPLCGISLCCPNNNDAQP